MSGREYNKIVENESDVIRKKILKYSAAIILVMALVTTLAAVFVGVSNMIF